MKVSEITSQLVAEYLRLDYATMTTAEKAELSAILAAAMAFAHSYTGIVDKIVTKEKVGTGDGETTVYRLALPVSGTPTVYIDGVETEAFLFIAPVEIAFTAAPDDGAEITADYTTGLDAHEDIVLAIYVLCQDMYDTRSYYVDKTNVNRVVEAILGMHCLNLL
jgi:hypothetical protein